jgi:multidrug efflux pump subunit AcrA (membrane-fusion protein)
MPIKWPKSIWFALIGVLIAAFFVWSLAKPKPIAKPLRQPPPLAYENTLVAAGIIESKNENVGVSPYRDGKVVAIYVKEGDWVEQGAALYAMDGADLVAQASAQKAMIAVQQANLSRLLQQPRPEDVAPLEAAKAQAQARYDDAHAQLSRYQAVADPKSVSQSQVSQQTYAVQSAQAALKQATAELARIKAGAWKPDITAAKAEVAASKAQIQQLSTRLSQSVVRAPQAGQVLKINTRAGESVAMRPTSGRPQDAPVVLGDTKALQVRVDIDEISANLFQPNQPATAFLKGNSELSFPLTFDHVQPYMVPKASLTGANTERVDVRVLQVIYTFTPPKFPVYVGQQVDIHIQTAKPSFKTRSLPSSTALEPSNGKVR